MSKHESHPIGIPHANRSGVEEDNAGVRSIDRWAARHLIGLLERPLVSIVLWDGSEIKASENRPVARVILRDRSALWRMVLCPPLGFGDGYSAGTIDVEGDLVDFNLAAIPARPSSNLAARLSADIGRWLYRPRRNTLFRSKANIFHHYDLGNEFYRLWLDEQMVYTCAYFPTPSMTLEQAQVAKMEHICRKLELTPDQTVVEAGCGWGSLGLHMARHHGVRVKAYNISSRQIAYARERVRAAGLADRVEYIEDDYRNIAGRYDAFVSVGMLEHVGTPYYSELGQIIAGCLKKSGRGLIHTIGRNRPAANNIWIERRIFPGSYPPSLREMMLVFEEAPFSVLDVENLRLHYAETLRLWLERFDRARDQVRASFDEAFVRAWRLYLAGSAAAFLGSSLQVFQVLFAYPQNNEIPRTRSHQYPHASQRAATGDSAH
jgi:cyclopropane-fatty-acyl-phospholipid synthase